MNGAVVISQTCDVVLPTRPNVLLAKLVSLDPAEASRARNGMLPRYVHVTSYGENMFADLDFVTTVTKEHLVEYDSTRGIDQANDVEVRDFARRIARRFGRYAFPNEVVPWFSPLQSIVQEKYRRPNSALGKALRQISELRVEASSWQKPGLDLTLHVIAKAGTVPELDKNDDDELPPIPQALNQKLRPNGDLDKSLTDIAEMLYGAQSNRLSSVERYHLWLAFAEAFGRHCTLKRSDADNPSYLAAVNSISGELSTDNDFNLAQFRRSEMLDLDHLSSPTPFTEQESD